MRQGRIEAHGCKSLGPARLPEPTNGPMHTCGKPSEATENAA